MLDNIQGYALIITDYDDGDGEDCEYIFSCIEECHEYARKIARAYSITYFEAVTTELEVVFRTKEADK